MTLDPVRRPSRRGWPMRTGEATTTAGTHDHQLPGWMFRVIIGQSLAILVLGATVATLLFYILGRGAYRDEQVQQLDQRINAAVCDLLDQLPEGGLLERPRAHYGCGPGIPLDDLPADEADRIRRQRGDVPAVFDPAPRTAPYSQAPVDPLGGATATDPYGAPTYGPPD